MSDQQPTDLDYANALSRIAELCDCNEKAAVMTNLTARAYKRKQDIEADIADLERREAERPE